MPFGDLVLFFNYPSWHAHAMYGIDRPAIWEGTGWAADAMQPPSVVALEDVVAL